MRKTLIIIATALCLSSCAITTSFYYADITLMNDSGEIINKWNDAQIGYEKTAYQYNEGWSTKSAFGMSFLDNQGKLIHLRGGIVIIDNFRTQTDINGYDYTSFEKNEIAKQKQKYNVLKLNIAECEKQIAKSNDDEFITLKQEQIQGLSRQMDEIKEYLQRTYNYKID